MDTCGPDCNIYPAHPHRFLSLATALPFGALSACDNDTTVLVAFARIRRLPLLRKVYPVVIAPPVVWKETRAKMHEWDGWWQPGMARWITGWLIVARPRDKAAIRQLLKDNSALDRGEAEAIVLALELEASTILTDDGAARDQAEALGLDYTGTIGILFTAKERGFIATIEPLLKKMRATRFSISKALYERTLRRAGEL